MDVAVRSHVNPPEGLQIRRRDAPFHSTRSFEWKISAGRVLRAQVAATLFRFGADFT